MQFLNDSTDYEVNQDEMLSPLERVRSLRADTLLEFYLRCITFVMLAVSMIYWCKILGVLPTGQGAFIDASDSIKVEIILFGILYPITAVGLWLLMSWGHLLWGVLVAAYTGFAVFDERHPSAMMAIIALHLAAICFFWGLRWRASRNKRSAQISA